MNICPTYHLQEIEDKVIVACLRRNRWNRYHSAKELGIGYRTLSHKIAILKHKGFKIQDNPKYVECAHED